MSRDNQKTEVTPPLPNIQSVTFHELANWKERDRLDLFAAAALQGLLARDQHDLAHYVGQEPGTDNIARRALDIADSMMRISVERYGVKKN